MVIHYQEEDWLEYPSSSGPEMESSLIPFRKLKSFHTQTHHMKNIKWTSTKIDKPDKNNFVARKIF